MLYVTYGLNVGVRLATHCVCPLTTGFRRLSLSLVAVTLVGRGIRHGENVGIDEQSTGYVRSVAVAFFNEWSGKRQ